MVVTTMLSRAQAVILERLEGSPLGRKVAAEAEAAILARRQAAVVEIDRLQHELEAALPKLTANVDKAVEALRSAEAALKAAQEAHRQAYGERFSAVNRIEMAQTRQRRILAEHCPPCVGVFVEEMLDLLQSARGWHNPMSRPTSIAKLYADDRAADVALAKGYAAAAEAQKTYLDAINAARIEADEELRLSALSDSEIEARLTELRANLEKLAAERPA